MIPKKDRQKRESRRRRKKTAFYVHIVRSCPVSADVRLKAEHDRGKTSPRMTEERRRSKLGDDSKNFYFVILS